MDVASFLQVASIIVAVVSATIAVASVVFAWKATKTADKSSVTSLLTELHKLYLSDPVFTAIDTAWTMYRKTLYKELNKELQDEKQAQKEAEKKADQGILIKEASAEEVVHGLEVDADKRKALHPGFWFWEHLAILVYRGLIDEELVLTGFGSPAILGFLYPVDEAWVRVRGMTGEYRGYLKQLYALWQKRK
jgi:hypothetical protein